MAEVPPTLESVDQKLTALLEAQARTGLHHLSHCPRPGSFARDSSTVPPLRVSLAARRSH